MKNKKYIYLVLVLVIAFLIGFLSTMSIWNQDDVMIPIKVSNNMIEHSRLVHM